MPLRWNDNATSTTTTTTYPEIPSRKKLTTCRRPDTYDNDTRTQSIELEQSTTPLGHVSDATHIAPVATHIAPVDNVFARVKNPSIADISSQTGAAPISDTHTCILRRLRRVCGLLDGAERSIYRFDPFTRRSCSQADHRGRPLWVRTDTPNCLDGFFACNYRLKAH